MIDNPMNSDVSTDPQNPAVPESGGNPTATRVATQQPADESLTGTYPTADNAAVTRLQQEVAKQKKLIETIGLDPDSDIADRVAANVITKEQLLNAINPSVPMTPQPPIQPDNPNAQAVAQSVNKIGDIRQKMESDGVTEDDVIKMGAAIESELQEIKSIFQEEKVSQAADNCARTVQQRLKDDDLHKQLPPELQEIEDQLFLSSTDNMVMQEAKRSNNPSAYLNTDMYDFMADKNAERLQKIRDHYIELGRQNARNGVPAGNINPIAPSVGGSPSGPSPVTSNKSNWKEMARQRGAQIARGIQPE